MSISARLVAVVPDTMERGGESLLSMMLEKGDETRIGNCIVIEADMDALALIDEARRLGASEIVLLGPLHRDNRQRGIYLERVEPNKSAASSPNKLVKELWGNLTGSLRLDDYVAAMRILYDKPFYVAECDPGDTDECRDLVEQWLREYCGQA
ncbi:hypothetical protein [Pyrofollis japonicus]|uniref:hypothetical protein n=1 Tax=Pyrofollis japonicus TaxID=3060460 RepID=UPI00295B5AE5|nr:hypothetical protein [Pyrofollis japonicus]